MIERFLRYISDVRRYSERTVALYRDVLQEYFSFASTEGGVCSVSLRDPVRENRRQAERNGACSYSRGAKEETEGNAPQTPPSATACDAKLLNTQNLRAYEVYLMDTKGESARTVNLHISVLSSFAKFLMKEGVLGSNPVSGLKRPKMPKRLPTVYRDESMEAYFEQTAHAVGQDELDLLLGYGPVPSQRTAIDIYERRLRRLIISLLHGTGIRRSELISLRIDMVDGARGVLRVRGKGDKMREIPLISSLYDEILLYLKAAESMVGRERLPDEPLLVTAKGNPLYPVFVDRAVKRELDRRDITVRKSPHVLRHTLATSLLDGGADLNSIKEMLGHSSLAATQVYTHNSVEKLKTVYNAAHPRAKKEGNHGD